MSIPKIRALGIIQDGFTKTTHWPRSTARIGRRMRSIVSRMWGEGSVDEAGVGDEPALSATADILIAALLLALLVSSCAAGWPPPPTAPECVFIPRCRNPALTSPGGN
jgi:hypothetical protein